MSTRWTIAVSVLIGILPALVSHQVNAQSTANQPSDATLIGTSPYLGGGLSTDGRYVVYGEGVEIQGLTNFDVLGIDLATGEQFDIATGPDGQSSPDVDGDYAVWYVLNEDRQAIDAMHLPTRTVFTVSETQYGNHAPTISGDWVVWQHFSDDGVESLMARNVRTMDAIQQIHTFPDRTDRPTRAFTWFEDGRILLYEIEESLLDPMTWAERWRISILLPDSREIRTFVEGEALYDYEVSPNGHTATLIPREGTVRPWGVDFEGSTLVYDELGINHNAVLVVHDIDTGVRREVASYPSPFGALDEFGSALPGVYLDRGFVATDGRYVFWQHTIVSPNEFGTEDYRTEVQGFDRESETGFAALGPSASLNPASSFWWMDAAEGVLAWSNPGEFAPSGSIPRELHAARILDLAPEVLKPSTTVQPSEDTSNRRYYPETGHTLQHGFLEFWERNGGLPVFGYPLTEEFSEVPADFGERYTVQYLERQRLEWHPENAGTPYEVLLGRLGYDDAAARGLLNSKPFVLPTADQMQAGQCAFFTETGHSVCGDFGDYWLNHGLNLGDSGVSYRESLALFGYPISEAYIDAETGLRIQYFERAVFEHHPDNDPAYQVLLRRLGADSMPAFSIN